VTSAGPVTGDGGPSRRTDAAALRARVRAEHRRSGRRFAVLDDDPTGSQCVHDVDVVFDLNPAACARALTASGAMCFALTNSRSLPEPEAFAVNHRTARSLYQLAAEDGWPITIVSRSDSTLRGHLAAETRAIDTARREVTGHGHDGVLLVPAYLEAGRATSDGVHRARIGDRWTPVGQTEFARDSTFGYHSSDLRDHVVERTGGHISRADVRTVALDDIRAGGPDRVAEVLAGVQDGAFVVVDALSYDDLEVVALAVTAAESNGQSFLPRTGPSFVRALAGIDPRPPLDAAALGATTLGATTLDTAGHGLVVVGSHVGLTNRQLAAARAATGLTEIELAVPLLLAAADPADVVRPLGRQVVAALADGDVLLVTSREVRQEIEPDAALLTARAVSAAVADVVRAALPARPAWIVAKGGITSHDVAVRGLGVRRATVLGQLYPGVVSVFRPVEAVGGAVGVPYVVFAGNVGDEDTLADVIARLRGSSHRPR
jgi:uncharacterized protein YgbK (DUF1537 family)